MGRSPLAARYLPSLGLCGAFEFGVLVGVGEKHIETMCVGRVGDSADGACKLQVLGVSDDDADRLAATGCHAACKLVGLVGEPLRCF